MILKQFYLPCLAHASYLIGDESSATAAVVDPQRDIDQYLAFAREHALQIRHVFLTHFHADFLAGHLELRDRVGATIYLGAAAKADYAFTPLRDGEVLEFGRVRLKILETPGHTPESISILVYDLNAADSRPHAVLTGDTLFIGDVGRPDLAPDLTPQQLAAMLYDSLYQKLIPLGDDVEVWPAHGAGSLCGKSMRAELQSTIGQERALNYALRARSKEEFVRLLTAELPERPGYFALDAAINRSGAPALTDLPPIALLSPEELIAKQAAGAVVLDTRPAPQFFAGHIPGAVHIALAGQYASWAATILGLDKEIILVAEDEEQLDQSRTRLARVGIERVIGALDGGMQSWGSRKMAAIDQISVEDLHRQLTDIQVIDVRRESEWEEGHIEGAHLMALHVLETKLASLDRDRPVAVHCKGGYRSAIAASLVQRAGFQNVRNVTGGFDAWRACGLPEIREKLVSA
ncbi:MAG TPA: MBL fold metallo-hydrolase [Candidatus Acidoferrum sp.]|nr:MBL fold metallo-hydrolase [Candidatus Acidoferrum sp.]